MKPGDIAIRFVPPESWAADFPMGSQAHVQVIQHEGLVFVMVGGTGGGPMHRITFTGVGFQRFAQAIAEKADE